MVCGTTLKQAPHSTGQRRVVKLSALQDTDNSQDSTECHPCPGWSYPRLCAARLCGAAASGQLRRPLPGTGDGAQGLQVAAGDAAGGGEPGLAEAPCRAGTAGGGGTATQRASAPGANLRSFSGLQKICGE